MKMASAEAQMRGDPEVIDFLKAAEAGNRA